MILITIMARNVGRERVAWNEMIIIMCLKEFTGTCVVNNSICSPLKLFEFYR